LVIFLIISFGLVSCAHSTHPNVKNMLPRKAFVHLEKTLLVKSCNKEKKCMSMKFRSSASGYIVKKQADGVFIITAAHFCENSIKDKAGTNVSSVYKAKRLDGTAFDAVLLHYQRDIDACLMYSDGMINQIEVVQISPRAPEIGEKIFNIGAPASIVGPGMVPILEGRYNGDLGISAFYTLPAYPGSSGSMILNEHGQLVGMVHSVYMNFKVMTLSTKYTDLKGFINKYVHKFSLYKDVMKDLDLDNIFVIEN